MGVILIAFVVLSYVFLVTEIKRINREKIVKQEILNEKINKLEMYLVEIQKLSSETRIVGLAQDSLGLNTNREIEKIIVPKSQIIQVENLLKEKYD